MSSEHWDHRFTVDPRPFDFYQRFKTCAPYRQALEHKLDKEGSTLIVGAGTSQLAEDLWEASYRSLHNIDYSPVCIRLLEQRYAGIRSAQNTLASVQNTMMDARAMSFADASFDAVIDKATLDSILCSDATADDSVSRMLLEISRVLKPGGSFFLLSLAPPEERRPLLERPEYGWSCEQMPVAKPESAIVPIAEEGSSTHFLYIMTKRAG